MHPDQWIDRTLYPFAPHYITLEDGQLHYIDEGSGKPIVFVHGTPVWSFLYRRFVADLARDYRCVALDHLGFGLSDKPALASYRPEDQARRFAHLLDQLELRDITLVVHDFGGPIGLAYALAHPERVRKLIIFNTWMWPMNDDTAVVRAGKIFSSRLGKLLYTRFNISPRLFYPLVFGDRSKLRRDVQQQYIQATSTPDQRMALWACACAITGSSDWYAQLWAQRECLSGIPALLLWGMKDPTFTPKQLARWQSVFTNAHTAQFAESGHFVQEEQPERAIKEIRRFLQA